MEGAYWPIYIWSEQVSQRFKSFPLPYTITVFLPQSASLHPALTFVVPCGSCRSRDEVFLLSPYCRSLRGRCHCSGGDGVDPLHPVSIARPPPSPSFEHIFNLLFRENVVRCAPLTMNWVSGRRPSTLFLHVLHNQLTLAL